MNQQTALLRHLLQHCPTMAVHPVPTLSVGDRYVGQAVQLQYVYRRGREQWWVMSVRLADAVVMN